jgi:hypothetical protein
MNPNRESYDQTREIRIPESPPVRKRRSWYLLSGLVLGLVIGLIYAWLVNPIVYSHATPAGLQADDQDSYRSMIAQVYAVTGDLDRAKLRLAVLEDDNPVFALGSQAQRCMAGGNTEEARSLALLASALQSDTPTNAPDPVSTQTLDFSTSTP